MAARRATAFFSFELDNGTVIADTGGHLCSIIEARQAALGLAMRLARKDPGLIGQGYAISVKSEDGVVRCRIELDDVHKRLLAH
jgi:hypothetical protein